MMSKAQERRNNRTTQAISMGSRAPSAISGKLVAEHNAP